MDFLAITKYHVIAHLLFLSPFLQNSVGAGSEYPTELNNTGQVVFGYFTTVTSLYFNIDNSDLINLNLFRYLAASIMLY